MNELVTIMNTTVFTYFVLYSIIISVLMISGWRGISEYVRRRSLRDYNQVAESDESMAVSILVPAYNEAGVIVETIRSLLQLHYANYEIVLINDGSSDDTMEVLNQEFSLTEIKRIPRAALNSKTIKGLYISGETTRLIVIDKENGGKSDALNAGLSFARYPLFCAIDSDTMLDPDALARLVWQFEVDPTTIACGGIVRIVNGSKTKDSRVTDPETPDRFTLQLQVMEYLRAFLVGRTGWSRLGMLLIISGAFGLFRRDAVIEAGGYKTDTVGEDAELVVRLHKLFKEKAEKYKVGFIADPVCWTEAPSKFRHLVSQRDRWQRGLMEGLWAHKRMLFNPKYGRAGTIAMPYMLIFEVLGPIIETLGYATMIYSIITGGVGFPIAFIFFGLAIGYGLFLSLIALCIEERAFQRYSKWRCMRRLIVAALFENFGYRQFYNLIRIRSFFTLRPNRQKWGHVVRLGTTITKGS